MAARKRVALIAHDNPLGRLSNASSRKFDMIAA
jgi:hypothetical protein